MYFFSVQQYSSADVIEDLFCDCTLDCRCTYQFLANLYHQFLRYFAFCNWSVNSRSCFYTTFKCIYLKNKKLSSNGFQMIFAQFFVLYRVVQLDLISFDFHLLLTTRFADFGKSPSRPPKICCPYFSVFCSSQKLIQ